jgi:uncharacterized membrane protein
VALDHVRDFFDASAMVFQPEDLTRTTPVLFLTRWITHVCAPAFVFLAGMAACRRLRHEGSVSRLSRFLWTRGLWLVLLEITVMRFALNFRSSAQDPLLLLVLTALGLSIMALAGLVRLPTAVVGALGVAAIALHKVLDPVQPADLGAAAPLWNLLHDQGVFAIAGLTVVVGYPVLPWIGVMAAGFASGTLFDRKPERRRRILTWTGAALVVAFVVLRLVNQYGDPSPWTAQSRSVMTALSFVWSSTRASGSNQRETKPAPLPRRPTCMNRPSVTAFFLLLLLPRRAACRSRR